VPGMAYDFGGVSPSILHLGILANILYIEIALAQELKNAGWSEFRIIANGPEIEILINGISTVNYLEKEKWIPREGHICLQAHSGGPYEIRYKDIRLKKL